MYPKIIKLLSEDSKIMPKDLENSNKKSILFVFSHGGPLPGICSPPMFNNRIPSCHGFKEIIDKGSTNVTLF